jgi:hypothetical protein
METLFWIFTTGFFVGFFFNWMCLFLINWFYKNQQKNSDGKFNTN